MGILTTTYEDETILIRSSDRYKQAANVILHFLTRESIMPKFHKIHRGICLALFLASSIASYFKPHLVSVATLSLIGVIAYDIICYLKEKVKVTDFSFDIKALQENQDVIAQHVKEMKDDVSIGKLASTFKRG